MARQRNHLPVAMPFVLWLMLGFGIFVFTRGAGAQTVEETQKEFLKGNYEEVIKITRRQVSAGDYGGHWRLLLCKALMMTGQYHAAHTNMLAMSDYSGGLEKRLLARETYLYQNDPDGAEQQLIELKDLVEQRFRRFQSEEPGALGRALLLLNVEPRLVLENCFKPAENASPPDREAFLAAGQLALDKHDYALAANTFEAGLKKFSDDPDLWAGLAQAFEPSDRDEMVKAIKAALAVNPKHIASLLLYTDHLIDAEQYDEAAKKIDLILQVNPYRPEALAYRAVLAHLKSNTAGEETNRAAALQFWKKNPHVDYLIGLKLAQKYQFTEGAAAQRRALDFDAGFLPARRELAQDLLRLGKTDEGWQLVKDVHARDDYDVAIYNLITLHDGMMKFQTLSNADFVVHMATNEARLYGNNVLDLLGRARKTLCAKYGIELEQPTTVDIFPEQKDFAVRTFGMPGNPGYLGVCFGSVITANSPASQEPNPANWEDVLWHEFCHVVTLTATKNRMPRWLSEGISVYEERQADPTWGERMDVGNREMILKKDGLTPLGQLSSAFLTPKSGKHLQFAYYESSLAIEFIVQERGLDALKQILRDLRDGKEINEAISAHTAPMAELEKQFAAFARQKAESLAPNVDLQRPPLDLSDAETEAWEKEHAKNYFVRMEKARKLMQGENWAEAKPILESLAADYSGEHRSENPLWLLAAAQRHLKDTNAELATLQKFAERESDFVDLYVRLIDLCGAKQDWPSVLNYSEKLLAVNPLISAPYAALAKAGAATDKRDVAIDADRKMLMLDPPDPAEVHFHLARLLHARGDAETEAKRHVLQALEEAPRYREAQRLLLEMEGTREGKL